MPRTTLRLGRPAAAFIVLLALVLSLPSLGGFVSGTGGAAPRALASGRDPYLWPFASDSIWNLPLGANAVYVPAHIAPATSAGMTTDPDVIILAPKAPLTDVYYNGDGWSGGSRCTPQGGVLFSGPIPASFVVPGASGGDTPNFATAILMPDNHTLAQGQPMARCTAGGNVTMMWYQEKEDLYGTGFSGGHGGSALSSLGGTIRLGELVPGGVIRHALKVNLYGHLDYYYDSTTRGYRWPATTADSYASSVYGGTVAALRMGSLLALPPGLNLSKMGLETQAALILAQAFQNYGAYTVDDTGWSVYAIETEFSPNGQVETQFQNTWGFSMTPSSLSSPWARDMNRIFSNLSVVDNWNAAAWQTVAASNGTQGAGGGAPRVPWAPPFGSSVPPPPPPPSVSQVTVSSPAAGTQTNPGQSIAVSWSSSGSLEPNSASLSFSSDGGSTWGSPFASGQALNGTLSWLVPNVTTNQAIVRVVARATNGTDVAGRSGLFVIQPASGPGSPGPAGTPIARFRFSPEWPTPSTAVVFDATPSSPSAPNLTLQARWDWTNDGVWDTGWSSNLTATHEYGAEGVFTPRVEVQDSSGGTDNATATVAIDGTPPNTAAAVSGVLGRKGWYTSVAVVTLSSHDAVSGVASTFVRIDAGSWQTYTLPLRLDEGRHTVTFDSVDLAGEIEAAHVMAVKVDRAPPVFHSLSPTGVVVDSTVSIVWNATNDVSSPILYATSVDGGPFLADGPETSIKWVLADGTHTVVVNATSESGNFVLASASFRVDTNLLSFTGPYRGIPTLLVIAAAFAGTLAVVHSRRSRARRHA